MSSFNLVVLEGRLTKDPELRQVGKDNIDVVNFSIAVNRRWNREEVDFFTVEAWRKLAEIVAANKSKGDLVLVKGELKQDTYEKDGQKRERVKVVADHIEFQPGKGDGSGGNSTGSSSNSADDDSIPF